MYTDEQREFLRNVELELVRRRDFAASRAELPHATWCRYAVAAEVIDELIEDSIVTR